MRFALLFCLLLSACALQRGTTTVDSPSEAARHRAALATVVVDNATSSALRISFRNATPPVQEITIGTAAPGVRSAMAPVPAGEPIILMARKPDGSQLVLDAQSLPLDAEWTWQIKTDAIFVKPSGQ